MSHNLTDKTVWGENGHTTYMVDVYTRKVYYILAGLYSKHPTGRLYPYRWDKKLNCWNECSGLYSVSYIRQLEKAGKVIYR